MSQISEQRRDQIVQSARRIVDEEGPRHLTAEAITQQVGVSRPLLYHYFENMNALLDTIIAIYLDEFAEKVAVWESAQEKTAGAPGGSAAGAGQDAWAVSLVAVLRGPLATDCPLLRDGAAPVASAAQTADAPGAQLEAAPFIDPSYPAFLDRCAQILTDRVRAGDGPAFAACRAIERPETAMYAAVHGVAAALRRFPDLTDEEAGALFAAPWRRPAVPCEPPVPVDDNRQTGSSAPSDEPAPKGGASGKGASDGKGADHSTPAKKGLFGWIFN